MNNIITMDRININMSSEPHEEVIRRCGNMLVKAGCAKPRYIEGMLARDRSFSTAIGNYIAIPHGEKEYKEDILQTGLAVLTYPQGIEWNKETVYLVIGIAARGEEHLEILENIVDKLEDRDDVLALVKAGNKQAIYDLLTGGAL